MNRDKKKIILFLILFCMLLTILGCSGCKKKKDDSKPVSDIEAEKKKDENRYITVINGTDSSTINLVEITAGEGILVTNKVNPDGKSFSFVIGEVWKDYTDFTVTLSINIIKSQRIGKMLYARFLLSILLERRSSLKKKPIRHT